MTDQQLYLTIGIPAGFFALNFLAILWQARGVEKRMDSKFDAVNAKFDAVNARFDAMNTKFDIRFDALEKIMNAKFQAAHEGLLRVEGILDARLKHLEER